MKKLFACILTLCTLIPALTACGTPDYSAHVSEARSDLFCAQTEEFSVTLACVQREYPFLADGIACSQSTLIEITLEDCQNAENYSVFLTLDGVRLGGEMTYRNIRNDYFFSQSVKQFPEGSVSLCVEWENESREIAATSVKNERTLTIKEALDCAVSAEKEHVQAMTENGTFCGEFYVRLLRRDKNYYYVGIIDRNGNTLALLLDGESGEVLAKRGK